jgi:hypothetical protein
MGGRCYACCQENCGFGPCSCSCHGGEGNVEHRVQSKVEPVPETSYTFYAVADRDDLKTAKWYRTYSANRSSGYVDDLESAKIWVKRGVAKGKCTQLGPSARLVEFIVTKVNVIDNSEHIKKAVEKRKQEEVRRQKAVQQQLIDHAKYEIAQAEARLRKLQGE